MAVVVNAENSVDGSIQEPVYMRTFVARQPIFTQHKEVYAYELLFRKGLENAFPRDVDGDVATSNIIMDLILDTMQGLVSGKKAFLNFSERLLLDDFAMHLPNEHAVIEVLEQVKAKDECLEACKRMKEAGYTVALDDFVLDEENAALVDYADIIKVDYRLSSPEERQAIIEKVSGRNIKLLAEKIETHEEFQQALEEGFVYFQGYFFSKPEIVEGRRMPESKLVKLELLRIINQPDVDFNKVSEVIKRDVSLTYKLLRYINSAAFGLTKQIESIQQAVVFLGQMQLKKWVNLIALAELGSDKPTELLVNAAMRAKLCEDLAAHSNLSSLSFDEMFLMGMFSRVDAILDKPMDDVLMDIPLPGEIKNPLLGQPSTYAPIYELVKAYEALDWERVETLCAQLEVDAEIIPKIYAEAINWASEVMVLVKAAPGK